MSCRSLVLRGNDRFEAVRGRGQTGRHAWHARYPLDLGHNYVLADARCNGWKSDRLSSADHLAHWCERNAGTGWTAALDEHLLSHDLRRTTRVAAWAYDQAERARATVWQEGKDGLVRLDEGWREALAT